mmetsp:Transcript_86219/g.271931  ORF Transcript_86219/g.271931 Transcript_86219/m.271931 type:complete len:357 (+) Transcript_86219:1361-2431(+)
MRHHVLQALAQDLIPLTGTHRLAPDHRQQADLLAEVLLPRVQAARHSAASQHDGGIAVRLDTEARALLELVREVRRQKVQVTQPSSDPTVRHEDVALEDLSAARIDLGDACTDNLPAYGPRDRAEASIADVVVLGPVVVGRQHGPDRIRLADEGEGLVPGLHAILEPLAPTRWHGGIDVDADLAAQAGEVVPPDRGDLPVDTLRRALVAVLAMLAKVLIVGLEVQDPVVRWPGPHRLVGQADHGETNSDGRAALHVFHGDVNVALEDLDAQQPVRRGHLDAGRDEEAGTDEGAAADDGAILGLRNRRGRCDQRENRDVRLPTLGPESLLRRPAIVQERLRQGAIVLVEIDHIVRPR